GAVNTVVIKDGKLIGTNTDAAGFLEPLQDKFPSRQGARVLVYGAGGAARACVHALKTAGAGGIVAARNDTKAKALAAELEVGWAHGNIASVKPDILVNATPAGTRGEHEGQLIVDTTEMHGTKLVYDLTYNPRETRLIREARSAGCDT